MTKVKPIKIDKPVKNLIKAGVSLAILGMALNVLKK
jgi:hypothetical protein